MEDIATPTLSKEAGYVTPDVNVIYGFGFMDLRRGPVILEVPDSNHRYYMVEIVDMWMNDFACVGGGKRLDTREESLVSHAYTPKPEIIRLLTNPESWSLPSLQLQ